MKRKALRKRFKERELPGERASSVASSCCTRRRQQILQPYFPPTAHWFTLSMSNVLCCHGASEGNTSHWRRHDSISGRAQSFSCSIFICLPGYQECKTHTGQVCILWCVKAQTHKCVPISHKLWFNPERRHTHTHTHTYLNPDLHTLITLELSNVIEKASHHTQRERGDSRGDTDKHTHH